MKRGVLELSFDMILIWIRGKSWEIEKRKEKKAWTKKKKNFFFGFLIKYQLKPYNWNQTIDTTLESYNLFYEFQLLFIVMFVIIIVLSFEKFFDPEKKKKEMKEKKY